MNRDYSTHRVDPSTNTLSRNSSNVSWGTKIRGAMQVTHGLGDAIRGSLGATDFGAHEYTSSGEIATRGRHEIAQGLARIRGVTTQLPPAPVYDRRHSFPTQQYEQPQRARSVWGRRSASAHRSGNPSTASSPFDKFYEHPYPAQQDQDPGFAGLGAGIDPARRKEGNDHPIVPAFIVHPPQPAPSSQSPYPSQTPYPTHPSYGARSAQIPTQYQDSSPHAQSSSLIGIPSVRASPRSSIAAAGHPADPYYAQIDNGHLYAASPLHHAPIDSATDSPISEPSSSTSRRSFPTSTNRHETNGKGKGKEKQSNKLRRGRIRSLFLASPSPNHDVTDVLDPSEEPQYQTRSAPTTPPPHRHESVLEHAGYDVLSYDAKDVYPHWPTGETRSQTGRRGASGSGARLEPVRSVRV